MYISILHTAITCSDALSTPIFVQTTTLGGKVPLAKGKRPSPALEDNMPSVFEEPDSSFPAPSLKCYAKPWESELYLHMEIKNTQRQNIPGCICSSERGKIKPVCFTKLYRHPGHHLELFSGCCGTLQTHSGSPHTNTKHWELSPTPRREGNNKAAQNPFQKDVQCDPSNET